MIWEGIRQQLLRNSAHHNYHILLAIKQAGVCGDGYCRWWLLIFNVNRSFAPPQVCVTKPHPFNVLYMTVEIIERGQVVMPQSRAQKVWWSSNWNGEKQTKQNNSLATGTAAIYGNKHTRNGNKTRDSSWARTTEDDRHDGHRECSIWL